MSSRWQPSLEQALRNAGLDPTIAVQAEPTMEAFCNRVAQVVSAAYLQGQVSWVAADAVINHLYPFMLECPAVPSYAWGVYEAFDAAEYHPDTPELSEDAVTRSALVAQVGSQHA